MFSRAVFLDRDGVLINDVCGLTRSSDIKFYNYVSSALNFLHEAGFLLVVVTNQTVVARGLISEQDVKTLNQHINTLLQKQNCAGIDGFYFCPHHPDATLPEFRMKCNCRKPYPGMLTNAAEELQIDLKKSYMVGDRISDIIAGHRAGCTSIQVQTGKHNDAPIHSDGIDLSIKPDFVCADLLKATEIILENRDR